ncbi:MAG TPA: sulfur oxidation c-type cytochrome SoxX [Myxococcaceae bacterium]|nr:sulfur oxidation c-type cytochrome SoxX [Myxococcaceae bacterium]
MTRRNAFWIGAGATAAALAVGCTTVTAAKNLEEQEAAPPPAQKTEQVTDYRAAALAVMKASFEARGQATLDRLEQDEVQVACSQRDSSPTVPRELAKEMEAAQLAAVKYPADGKYLGSWEKGEAVAQNGRGMQFSDDPSVPSGGNCYACHQMAPKEVAFGTIGPSLHLYGKLRGTSEGILKYTWAKLWNSQAFTACSDMPRFGHKGILTEEQLKDVMAYLFDPNSPVNQQ